MDPETKNIVVALVMIAGVISFISVIWLNARKEAAEVKANRQLMDSLKLRTIRQAESHEIFIGADKEKVEWFFEWETYEGMKYVTEYARDVPRHYPVEIGAKEAKERGIPFTRLTPVLPIVPIEYWADLPADDGYFA